VLTVAVGAEELPPELVGALPPQAEIIRLIATANTAISANCCFFNINSPSREAKNKERFETAQVYSLSTVFSWLVITFIRYHCQINYALWIC
jgi:hypothetical protein